MVTKLQDQYDAISLTAQLLINKELKHTPDTKLLVLEKPLLDAAETIKSLMRLVELTKNEVEE
jgi:hypothetical protein